MSLVHQPEGTIPVMGRRLGQNLDGATSVVKVLEVHTYLQLPLQFPCVATKSALALTLDFYSLCQTDQKGEVELPQVIRK